jgi:hypothetical protein
VHEVVYLGKGGIQQFIVRTGKVIDQKVSQVWSQATQDKYAFEVQYHCYERDGRTMSKTEQEQLCELSYAHPYQQRFTSHLNKFVVIKNIEMPDHDAVSSFSFKRFSESMHTMLTSLICFVSQREPFQNLPFFIEIIDDIDDLVSIRGIVRNQILFTTR